MFEEFSLGLGASSGSRMSSLGIEREAYVTLIDQKSFLCHKEHWPGFGTWFRIGSGFSSSLDPNPGPGLNSANPDPKQ
jgi:hypothetical protein